MARVFPEKFKAGTRGLMKDGYYLDNGLKEELDHLSKAVRDDWDGVILVDGIEGGGKSIFAQQIGYYLDPKLSVNEIVFSGEDFIKVATEMKDKNRVVIFDEAFAGLSSRAAMSQMNKSITRMLMEIRQKNLFLILILPTFFELDRYAAIFRSRCLLHIKANNFKRGDWEFYGFRKKKDLYMYGKKYYNYNMVKRDLFGRFMAFTPIDPEEYKKKKTESLTKAFDPNNNEEQKKYNRAVERRELEIISSVLNNYKQFGLKKIDLSKLLGFSSSKLYEKSLKIAEMDSPSFYNHTEGGESEEKEEGK